MSGHPSLATLTSLLRDGRELTCADIPPCASALLSSDVDDGQKAALLSALRRKGETAKEIAGFAQAFLTHAVDPGLDASLAPGPLLDICGTGGDQLHLFNVSTTAMFILAAGGAAVVKHGNRAITSQSGGADVLEALGIRIDLPPAQLRECVYRLGVGFLFAPAYHPAFKAIAPVRKQLAAEGIPTIFNLLGPLLNPARPAYQLIGLFSEELLPKYAEAIALLPRRRVWAVHGSGMDELSTLGPTQVRDIQSSASSQSSSVATSRSITSLTVSPTDLGFAPASLDELRGGDRAQNAAILRAILSGEDHGPRRDLVILNAAAGFVIAGLAEDLPTGCAIAQGHLEAGTALAKLESLQVFSQAIR
jgi:anthranilate phosphoribosyltransferase